MVKNQLCFDYFTGGKELDISRGQSGGFVELLECFFKVLVLLQLQAFVVGFMGSLEILFADNAIDSSDKAIATGNRGCGAILGVQKGGRADRDPHRQENESLTLHR
jgi:hypothetical protein